MPQCAPLSCVCGSSLSYACFPLLVLLSISLTTPALWPCNAVTDPRGELVGRIDSSATLLSDSSVRSERNTCSVEASHICGYCVPLVAPLIIRKSSALGLFGSEDALMIFGELYSHRSEEPFCSYQCHDPSNHRRVCARMFPYC